MTAMLQAAINNTQSERLKQVLHMTPQFLALYFSIALRDVNDSRSTIPKDTTRIERYVPVRPLIETIRGRRKGEPGVWCCSPDPDPSFAGDFFARAIRCLRAISSPVRSVVRGRFLRPCDPLLAGNFFARTIRHLQTISTPRAGRRNVFPCGEKERGDKRLSDFMLAAFQQCPKFIALLKVARSRNIDRRVWRRACDYLGLMSEPAICLSILGPSTEKPKGSGIINWSEGGSKMIAHVPFYILSEQEG
ncbi:hypothetical protein B296_00036292 [Ensete ventricosum]|uniref:Uncharacterized protein n=1 Tax=Ensete ventricosum TaxID=4639 RepID=A0A427A360_ENSVE|nr:hypothetical protein B296_00036292 [Ensete ventricosum]